MRAKRSFDSSVVHCGPGLPPLHGFSARDFRAEILQTYIAPPAPLLLRRSRVSAPPLAPTWSGAAARSVWARGSLAFWQRTIPHCARCGDIAGSAEGAARHRTPHGATYYPMPPLPHACPAITGSASTEQRPST